MQLLKAFIFQNSRPKVFCETCFQNICKIHMKALLLTNLIKRGLRCKCFPVNVAKVFVTGTL